LLAAQASEVANAKAKATSMVVEKYLFDEASDIRSREFEGAAGRTSLTERNS
jgi:hypothetical protein